MSKSGLTEGVINYLTTRTKFEPLSWLEFFTIWKIEGSAFLDTSIFQEKMAVFFDKRKKKNFSEKMAELKKVIPNKDAKELLIVSLPFNSAILLCNEFWDYWRLFKRIKNRNQKEKILQCIRELVPAQKFRNDGYKSMLHIYFDMSKDFPVYRETALLLIESKVLDGDETLWNLKKEITYTDSQIKGLLSVWMNDRIFLMSDLFELLFLTGSALVSMAIIKHIQETGSNDISDITFEKIRKNLSKDSSTTLEIDVYAYLPILCAAVEKMPNLQSEEVLRSLLPTYDEKNDFLVQIVEKVLEIICIRQKYVTSKQFMLWYKYCKNPSLIRLCIVSIIDDRAYWNLENSVQAYELCLKPEIIEAAIHGLLPGMKYGTTDQIFFFLNWAKPLPWFADVKKVIIDQNKMEEWWNDLYCNDANKYLTLMKTLL